MGVNYYISSDENIAAILGERLERLRLDHHKQLTQAKLAKQAGMSRSTYQKLIEGKGTLINLISVLRVLDGLDNLDALLPEKPLSPVQLLKMQGKVRQRVRQSQTDDDAPHFDEQLDW